MISASSPEWPTGVTIHALAPGHAYTVAVPGLDDIDEAAIKRTNNLIGCTVAAGQTESGSALPVLDQIESGQGYVAVPTEGFDRDTVAAALTAIQKITGATILRLTAGCTITEPTR